MSRARARMVGLPVVWLWFAAASPAGVAAEPAGAEAEAARGAAAIERVRTELGQALKRALTQGPIHAVDVCRVEAPRIAAAAGEGGVRVGRTSRRLRNPANAPEPWMVPLLDAFASPAPERSRVVDLGSQGTGVVAPIEVQPLCTTCHGTSIDPALRAHLAQQYPEDQAVGYRVGDFRGLFWAVVPSPGP